MPSDGVNMQADTSGEVCFRFVRKVLGGSSSTWQWLVLISVFGTVGMLLLFGVAYVLNPYGSPFFFICLFGTSGFLVLGILAACGVQVQYRRELARGYTCSPIDYVNAAQIDPRTGVVIRDPGEPLLSKDERAQRVARAREWARKSRR